MAISIKNKRTAVIIAILFLFVAYLVINLLSQPNTENIKGGFTAFASIRNENNTGPVIRLYGVEVRDIRNAQYEVYGNYMPHTKYGQTTVFFFAAANKPKSLYAEDPYFDTLLYHPIAVYHKNGMGKISLKR